jgi:sulfonate transport system substrate-binding protein
MRVGGVPEHYNAPIHRALEQMSGIEWISFPSGTGAMLDSLDKGEIDLAILLTEGVCKHALTTGRSKIVGTFVDNPLPWGVHVKSDGLVTDMEYLNSHIASLTFGISRFGSGSHLMAIVHAARLSGSPIPNFKVVDTMKGAREAMDKGEIDVFLWDITTADVYARDGTWKVIGTVSGDWPAFVFATNTNIDDSTTRAISTFIDNVRREADRLMHDLNGSAEYLIDKFKISEKQAMEFLETIRWNAIQEISQDAVSRVIKTLTGAGIVEKGEYQIESILACRGL